MSPPSLHAATLHRHPWAPDAFTGAARRYTSVFATDVQESRFLAPPPGVTSTQGNSCPSRPRSTEARHGNSLFRSQSVACTAVIRRSAA
ncbi:hypothetical protein VTN02DRAFT_6546 [Thermoascus thermophilus]